MPNDSFEGRVCSPWIDGPVVLSSLALNLLSLIVPLSILLIFDRVIPNQSMESLTLLGIIMLGATVITFGLQRLRSVLVGWSADVAARQNGTVFLRKILGAEVKSFSDTDASVHMERYRAIGTLRDYYAGSNQSLRVDLPFIAVFVVAIGLIGGALVLVPLCVLLMVVGFALFTKRLHRRALRERKGLDGRRFAFLAEVLGQVLTVKANAMEPQMIGRFEKLQNQTVDISERLIRLSGLAQNYGAVLSQGSVAAIGLLGAYLVLSERIGIAELAACMLLNGRIVQPLMKLMSHWVQSETISIANAKLAEINQLEQAPVGSGEPAFSGEIELSDLRVSDVNGREYTVSTEGGPLVAGQIILVEAETDGAVNAFFDALCGQDNLTFGDLKLGGLPSSQRRTQRGTGALVRLEKRPVILSGTLMENLLGFGASGEFPKVQTLSSQLLLEQRVHRLPLGYQTDMTAAGVFQENPVNRQLISLVRALGMDASVLLMQEPSAVLEVPERDALAQCFSQMRDRPTLVIASPDPRLKKIADRKIVVVSVEDSAASSWLADAAGDQAMASKARKIA
ncbi:MAG: ABC transporter transmembrane domain-containing protein [Pseudomonadota bacterium]